jgi:hypothetical protein
MTALTKDFPSISEKAEPGSGYSPNWEGARRGMGEDFEILDFGLWILDFGFWLVSLVFRHLDGRSIKRYAAMLDQLSGLARGGTPHRLRHLSL